MAYSIRNISTVLGADTAAHDALRKAASYGELGDPLRLTDGRGTQYFGSEALFRAALILALRMFRIHGEDAYRLIAEAEVSAPTTLERIISSVRADEGWRFIIRRDCERVFDHVAFERFDAGLLFGSDPMNTVGVLALTLDVVWRAPLAATSGSGE